MFSYGTELPSYLGLMERHFASLYKGTRYCKCKGLETLTSLASLSWPPCCTLCWKCCMRWILSQASAFPAESPWSKDFNPWVLEVRKDNFFFLVNANYVFKWNVLFLKGGRAALSALQFLSLRSSSLEPVASHCSSIHPESTQQILQKEPGGLVSASPTGERLLWQSGFSCFSSFFSSVTFRNKRMLLLNQMCLKLAEKCLAALVDRGKNTVLF